jgi:hypothetical protein
MEDEWDPDDIGFFYPDMPSSWGADELIDRDHSTYHRTAHSFVWRLQRCDTFNQHILCKNLPSCFEGKAHTWWLNQNPTIQRGLTCYPDIEQWCKVLLKAFELSPDETFAAFDAVRYTVGDALNRRDTYRYIHFLTSAAKQCGIPEDQWTLWAWQHLEQPIRRLIPKPGKGVTSEGFGVVLQNTIRREYCNTKPSWDKNKPHNRTGPTMSFSNNPIASQPRQATGSIQSLQPIQPIQPVQPVQDVKPAQPATPTQPSEINAATPPPSPTLSTATTATGTITTPIYSSSKVVIRPRSSFHIPIRNPPKERCSFTPLQPLLSQCGCLLKSEWLRVFNYSNKPIVINRRACLGSVLKPP